MSPPQAAAGDRAVEAGRGALFIGFAKGFFMLSGFVQQVLLARIVGSAGYGAFSVVNGMVSTVNNTVVQATIQAVSKFTAEDDARAEAVKRAALRMQAVLGTALALGFFLGAPVLAGFVNAPDYVPWFRLVAAIPLLYAFYAVFVGSANGLRRFRTQAGFDVGFSSAKTVLLLAFAAVAGVTGAFAGFVAAAVLILAVAARVMGLPRREVGARPFPARRLAVFMGGVVAYGILINVALNYDLWLIKRFSGETVDLARASALAGHYQGVRNLALLPYQALMVVTFVVFPLVSRSTFDQDRETTRAYVTQTMRYALMLAAGMGVVLGARPAVLLGILYRPEFLEGAIALPVLVAGECCLALLAVAGAIVNAAGRPPVAVALVALTVIVGSVAAAITVPGAQPGSAMLLAGAASTAGGMAAGLLAALVYLRTKLGGGPPPGTVARVAAAALLAVVAGRLMPGQGRLAGLLAIAAVAAVYGTALVVLRELGPEDRAKIARIVAVRPRRP